MLSDDQIKATILLKLYKRGNWGASHTAFENLRKGFKDSELSKAGLKRVGKMARELIRIGLVIPKPTSYGLQVSLNPRQHQKIISIMKRHFPEI